MGNADTIRNVSDEDLIAELKRRASESDVVKQQALEALADDEVRPDLEKTLKGSGEPAPENTKKDELSPEQQSELFAVLETRFNGAPKHYKRPEGVIFAEVKAALEANPELMWKIHWMEKTGGEPDVVAEENDTFRFRDFSAESPGGRRNLNYFQSAEMAEEIGVDIVSEEVYRTMQKTGVFDQSSIIWLKSDDILDKGGFARLGGRFGDHINVNKGRAGRSTRSRGWRAELQVSKVKSAQ